GGCIETSHATTHADPIFEVDGIVHYCVANMPGAVARTSTQALANATLPYGLKIAKLGVEAACKADKGLMEGLNCYDGKITFKGVAEAFGMECVAADTLI
ncbi:MAG: alanine dehydrogenase, partial [Oscillospiraceae bacterium]|nr:alanine dehydrogenase [Oscillospiraceae bacterium]